MKPQRRKSTRGRPPACQLCDWYNVDKHPGGSMPRAIAKICGLIICRKHVEIIQSIASENGQRADIEIVYHDEERMAS